MNKIVDLEAQIEQKGTEKDELMAIHDQQRSAIKQADKQAAELEKKEQEFNAEAARVVGNYTQLTSDMQKFESRMAEKQAELDTERDRLE